MKKVTYRGLAMAGAIVLLGTGLAMILEPRQGPEYGSMAAIFALGSAAVIVVEAILLGSRNRAKGDIDDPVPERVGRGIANTVVIVWLALVGLLAWVAYSTKPSASTAFGIAAMVFATVGGGLLIARKSKIRFLIPYGISAVVAVMGMLGWLVLAKALWG